jgi:tripartite-type tricarboxylate transporter receptor subunit TctC
MQCLIRFIVSAVTAVLVVGAAQAQTYPNRAIRLIVAFPPGGATDIIARAIGAPLGERLGQTVVIDNRPGSNGNIAADLAANAQPNGYTLFHGFDSLFSINPHLYSRMTVDPHKAFVPIGTMISNQLVLAVNPSKVPVKDFREFIEFAKRANPPLFYASIGNGSQHHLAMEMLKRQAGIEMTHVPFKGGGPAGISVVSGESALMFGGGSVVPLIKSGKLKGLAVSGSKRSPALPDLPRIGEVFPGYEVPIWHGLFAPLGTPQDIIDKLRTELNAVLAIPEVGQRLINTGSGEPFVTTPQEFAALMRRDYERYGKVIKEIGLKVD